MPLLAIKPQSSPVAITATTQYAESYSESVLVADFGSLPPEVNSGRMYAGRGPGSLLTAAATWDRLAADLYQTAESYQAVASELTTKSWLGPASLAMMGAIAPYVAWLHETAALAARTALQARAAVAAYEAARAMTIPPPVIAANRAQLATLVATNALGLNTPAIAANEAQYGAMWAQDSTAMYLYADTSASASNLTPFIPPPATTSETGVQTAHEQAVSSTIVRALQRLASPSANLSAAREALDSISGHARTGASTTSALMGALALAKPVGAPAPAAAAASPGLASAVVTPPAPGSLVAATFGGAVPTASVGKAAAVGGLSAPRTWLAASSVGGTAAPAPGVWSPAPISGPAVVPVMPVLSMPGRGAGSYAPASRPGLRSIVRTRSSGGN
jgi:PPE-repeat protein